MMAAQKYSPTLVVVLALFSAASSLQLSSTCRIPHGWTAKNLPINMTRPAETRTYTVLQPPPVEMLQFETVTLPYESRAKFSGRCLFNVHGVHVHFSGGCSLNVNFDKEAGSSDSSTSLWARSWNPSEKGLSADQTLFSINFSPKEVADYNIVFKWDRLQGSQWGCLVFADFISGSSNTGILTSDVDECGANNHECVAQSQTCVNTFGSYCCSPLTNGTKSGRESPSLLCPLPDLSSFSGPGFGAGGGPQAGLGGKGSNAVAIAIPIFVVLLAVIVASVVVYVKVKNIPVRSRIPLFAAYFTGDTPTGQVEVFTGGELLSANNASRRASAVPISEEG